MNTKDQYNFFLDLLHNGVDPYTNIDLNEYPATEEERNRKKGIRGSSFHCDVIDPFFEKADKPELILEVGSWYGGSAIDQAYYLEEKGLPGLIICVDTWLGDAHLRNRHCDELKIKNGRPTIYEEFLANVKRDKVEHRILPLPFTSIDAGRFFKVKNIKFDMIYIDASHETFECLTDMDIHWQNLKEGGIMFGDDYHPDWGVIEAVGIFSDQYKILPEINQHHCKWIFKK